MFKSKVQRYSIRKLSVGAASVLIGLAFLTNNNDKVQAATKAKAQTEGTEEKAEVRDAGNESKNIEVRDLNDLKASTLSTSKAQENKQQDPAKQTHKVTINYIDDTTGQAIKKYDIDTNSYQSVTAAIGEFKDGDLLQTPRQTVGVNGKTVQQNIRVSTYFNVPGYKLLNLDDLAKVFPKYDEFGTPYMTGDKDVNITLHYAPLSDTLVKYVDEATGETLAHMTFDNKKLNLADPIKKVISSRYEANAINIPGYELVSEPVVEGQIKDNEYKTKGNANPTVIVFKYKKITPNEVPADINLNNNIGGVGLSGESWAIMPGMFTTQYHEGHTITTDGRKVEAASKELVDRYTKQGFSYVGTSGKILDADPYNSVTDGSDIHFIPNKPVTVKYVDENGKEIAASDTIAFNHNNPDQTNQGINAKAYWHPEGEWSTTAKNIKGYDHVKTLGSENGKFTSFAYDVTYVYAKHVDGGITYIDDTAKKDLANDKFEGTVGKNIDYTTADKIANYEKLGYKLVSNNFNDGRQLFAKDGNNFEVHLVHTTDTKKDSKTITRVVNYVDENGKSVAGSVTQTATIEGVASVDKVTGKTSDFKWSEANFKAIATPAVKDYHVTKVTTEGNVYYSVEKSGDVAATAVTEKNGNTEVTVHFAKNAEPEKPTKPSEPQKPVEPTKPEPQVPETEVPDVPAPHGEDVPVTPSEETEDVPAPHGQDIPTDPSKDEEPETVMPHASAEPEAPKAEAADEEETVKPHAAALPQTGAKENSAAVVAGLALLGLMGIASVGGSKKRRN